VVWDEKVELEPDMAIEHKVVAHRWRNGSFLPRVKLKVE
jgi:hypothetical protein